LHFYNENVKGAFYLVRTVNARFYDSDVMAGQKAELSIQYSTIQ